MLYLYDFKLPNGLERGSEAGEASLAESPGERG